MTWAVILAPNRFFQEFLVANRKDPMGIGLQVLNRIASMPAIDRLGLRKTTEKAVYHGTKSGFQTVGAVNRAFKQVRSSGKPTRLARTKDTGVFDLSPTEDQQMIVEVITDFANEVLRPGAVSRLDAR